MLMTNCVNVKKHYAFNWIQQIFDDPVISWLVFVSICFVSFRFCFVFMHEFMLNYHVHKGKYGRDLSVSSVSWTMAYGVAVCNEYKLRIERAHKINTLHSASNKKMNRKKERERENNTHEHVHFNSSSTTESLREREKTKKIKTKQNYR